MKVVYLITARLKSVRLPRKLMREVHGKPLFAHMLDRLKLAERVDEIVVCTSTNPEDTPLVELAARNAVSAFRGDEEDVLKRLHDAARAHHADYILNITADCPFVDPVYADRIVEAFEKTDADLIRALDLPHGAYSYGIKPEALRKVLEIKDDVRTEVWGRYFTDTDLFRVYDLPVECTRHRRPTLRMTLDYPEDLAFFQAVFDGLYTPGKVFSLDDILDHLEKHPEIIDINKHCAGPFLKRWTRQASIRLKPRYAIRRAVVVGCGSIGCRHIGNLRQLGVTDITALRTRAGHHQGLDPQLEVVEVDTWEALEAVEPDIAIVSNPTSLHLETARRLLPRVRGLFIEKPLAASLDGVQAFLKEVAKRRRTTFVGYNLQCHAVVKKIQEILAADRLGRPLVFQAQCGHWLPAWHPYEDYTQSYAARDDLGGGVTRTLIHEIHLARTLMGDAFRVTAFLSGWDTLPLDVDVISDLMIRHDGGGVSQVHLDFIQKRIHRSGVVSCERGWIDYDLARPRVTVYDDSAPGGETVLDEPELDANQQYVDLMETFLRYTREGRVRHEFDVWNAARSLAIADAALGSARTGMATALPSRLAP